MQDLKKATGLHPGSIYCAFENKQGLLLSALEQYALDRTDEFEGLFENVSSIKAGLRAYLDMTINEITATGQQCACLSQKALSELGQINAVVNDQLLQNMNGWRDGFSKAFAKAIENGEINGSRTAEQRARYFTMGIQGLRSFAQTPTEANILREMAEQLLEDACR
jgi:AcrR family transcriptional regulator